MVSAGPEVAETLLEKVPGPLRDYLGGTGLLAALLQSFLMIIVTELGDKTFFIAAIMAMKHPRGQVLFGALMALYVMTILSAALGKAFPLLFNKKYTSIAASGLFVYFGFVLLRDWYRKRDSDGKENEELQEVEEELSNHKDLEEDKNEDKSRWQRRLRVVHLLIPAVVINSFTLTFLAEWGDRSQIATIALAAAKNVYGVTVGGMLGHTICTGLAVVGGRLLATKISERMVLLIGGVLFLLFAGLTGAGVIS